MAKKKDYFTRIYRNNDNHIGFDCADGNWLSIYPDHEGYGIRIDKFYETFEPLLSIIQARKLALKLLSFCDRLEHKDYKQEVKNG